MAGKKKTYTENEHSNALLSSKTDSESESNDESQDNIDIQDLYPDDRDRSETILTSRLAVNYMDWDNIDASDIFVIMTSFCNKSDVISVRIYLSEYGQKQLKHEEQHGPSIESDKVLGFKQYYLNRRKYYFGVVKFASSEIALQVYNSCDGMEQETTSLVLDLSFIGDEIKFKQDAVSECLEYPSNYTPNNFIVKALQQTNVDFEWDETESRRLSLTHKKAFSEKDLDDFEKFDKLLAPPSDEENKDKYRVLLDQDTSECSEAEESSEDASLEKSEEPLSIKPLSNNHKSFSDPFLTLKPQRVISKAKINLQEESNLAEMDLILFNPEEPEDKHFDYIKEMKQKSKKKKHVKCILNDNDDMGQEIDVTDKRFSALFNSPSFAIDPTSSQYKKTKNMKDVLKLQTTKRKKYQ